MEEALTLDRSIPEAVVSEDEEVCTTPMLVTVVWQLLFCFNGFPLNTKKTCSPVVMFQRCYRISAHHYINLGKARLWAKWPIKLVATFYFLYEVTKSTSPPPSRLDQTLIHFRVIIHHHTLLSGRGNTSKSHSEVSSPYQQSQYSDSSQELNSDISISSLMVKPSHPDLRMSFKTFCFNISWLSIALFELWLFHVHFQKHSSYSSYLFWDTCASANVHQ